MYVALSVRVCARLTQLVRSTNPPHRPWTGTFYRNVLSGDLNIKCLDAIYLNKCAKGANVIIITIIIIIIYCKTYV